MDEYKNTVEWQDGNIFDEKGGILDEKVDILPQSKVKESKAKESKGKKKSVADAPPVRYADDPLLDAAICDFIADRKERKKPMTSRAIASLIMQLDALASDVPTKIAILSSQLPGAGRGYSRSKTARERNPPTS